MSTGVKATTEADLFPMASRVAGMSESKTMAVAASLRNLKDAVARMKRVLEGN